MGVRITHIPTGMSAESRVHREQHRNKREAFQKLAGILAVHVRNAVSAENNGSADIPQEVIRTYHEPDDRVVDHRTGKRAS